MLFDRPDRRVSLIVADPRRYIFPAHAPPWPVDKRLAHRAGGCGAVPPNPECPPPYGCILHMRSSHTLHSNGNARTCDEATPRPGLTKRPMQHRRLGDSGLLVSAVGIGCNQFGLRVDAQETETIVNTALELGITLFDTADSYGPENSESFLGKALQGRRHQAIVATKFSNRMGDSPLQAGASRRYLIQALEASLRRLKTDYVDLYQIHRPDPTTPIEETLGALDDLVHQGRVRYIGLSRFLPWELNDAWWTAKAGGLTRPISTQSQFSLLDRVAKIDLLPVCRKHGVSLLPYHPLAYGLLSGKYHAGTDVPNGVRLADPELARTWLTQKHFRVVDQLTRLAAEWACSLLDLTFGWLLSQEEVGSVIAGVTNAQQVADNVRAGSYRLSDQQMSRIAEVLDREA